MPIEFGAFAVIGLIMLAVLIRIMAMIEDHLAAIVKNTTPTIEHAEPAPPPRTFEQDRADAQKAAQPGAPPIRRAGAFGQSAEDKAHFSQMRDARRGAASRMGDDGEG
jgi:hypothetical protein